MSEVKKIQIPEVITVHDLASKLDTGPAKLVGELMKNGVMATINEQIDFDTAAIIAGEFGYELELLSVKEDKPSDSLVSAQKDLTKEDKLRPPIIAVMGHVDHGKTSLLDAIRQTNVVRGEAGGITQHIGAYQVEKSGREITFLDTPGHEAFTALRAHGAKMTDIAIIVVAADDGVKPQTKEAIEHTKEAKVPIIIALNKIDKANADPNRVKQELSEIGVVSDEWGGEVPFVEVSAKTGDGLDKLLEMILLVADILEPKAQLQVPAGGMVIESHLESGRGPVVTMLVQRGCLRVGDYVVVGRTYGKIRSLEGDTGKKIKSALPSTPIVISGLKAVPDFGDWFEVVDSEKIAKDWLSRKVREASIKSLVRPKSISAQELVQAVDKGKLKELPVIIKADTQGSLESLSSSLLDMGNNEVRIRIVGSSVGNITENDINTASAAGAIILGFHISIKAAVNQLAKQQNVNFKIYQIIYELLDDVYEWLSSLLEPEVTESQIGRLKVLAVFKQARDYVVTGGVVEDGKILPNLDLKIIRAKEQIGRGKLTSLEKNKQPAKEVMIKEECGLKIDTTTKLQVDDEIVFIKTETKKRTI